MNDEIKNIARKLEQEICPGCIRRRDDRKCETCPVAELADMCRDGGCVKRTLISKQQFEYLCDLGVVAPKKIAGNDGTAFDLVRYPYDMYECALLGSDMQEDLLKDTPWSIRFNTVTKGSSDLKAPWSIPAWLFMENQIKVLTAYFGREKK